MDTAYSKNKRVLLATWSTRGDFNPILSLALEFKRRGANVVLACDEEARNWVESEGIEFLSTGRFPETSLSKYGDPEHMIYTHPKFLKWNDYERLDFVFSEIIPKEYTKIIPVLRENFKTHRPDLVVAHAGMLGAMDVATEFDIPLIYANVLAAFMIPYSMSLPTKWSGFPFTMTWSQYFKNLWLRMKEVKVSLKYLIQQQKIRRQHGFTNDMMDLFTKTRCIQSSIPGFSFPISLPPHMSLVGPFISKTEQPKMSVSLNDWLNAHPSTVYVSFGTTGNPTDAQWVTIVSALKKSSCSVLISARDHTHDHLQALISNDAKFRVEHWVPQKSVLQHNSVKVFMSHCGFGSINESLFYGKPVLGMPFFFDQTDMAARLVEFGAGQQIDRHTLDVDTLTIKINQLLENQSFSKNAQKLAVILRAAGGVERAVDICEEEMYTRSAHLHLPPSSSVVPKIMLLAIVGTFAILNRRKLETYWKIGKVMLQQKFNL